MIAETRWRSEVEDEICTLKKLKQNWRNDHWLDTPKSISRSQRFLQGIIDDCQKDLDRGKKRKRKEKKSNPIDQEQSNLISLEHTKNQCDFIQNSAHPF